MTKALGVGELQRAEWETCEATQENADRLFPPSDIGPIWVKDTFGNWLLPEYTLGWDVIAWAESNLSAIRGSGPLQLTPEQMRVILWYYAIDRTASSFTSTGSGRRSRAQVRTPLVRSWPWSN